MNTKSIHYYDPTSMQPFDNRHIPAPARLENDEDYTMLFQHLISELRESINCYGREYGYGDRQRLLASILMLIKNVIPVMYPIYLENYPASLADIKVFVAELILTSVGFTGLHQEEEFTPVLDT